MSTQAQINANRTNAKKSTGPQTPEGKAAASQNSIKHGLFASQNVISSESQAEFDLFREKLLEDLAPATPIESMFAERFVSLSWRLKRTETIHNQAIDALKQKIESDPFAKLTKSMLSRLQPTPQDNTTEPTPDLPLGRLAIRDFANSRVLDRLFMYERRIENSLYKTMLELQRLKLIKNINSEHEAPPNQSTNQPVSAPGILSTRALGKNISESSVSSVAKNKNMQNEPNLQNTQINATSFPTSNYGKFRRRQRPKNEPKTNPILVHHSLGEGGSNPVRTQVEPAEAGNVGLKSNL